MKKLIAALAIGTACILGCKKAPEDYHTEPITIQRECWNSKGIRFFSDMCEISCGDYQFQLIDQKRTSLIFKEQNTEKEVTFFMEDNNFDGRLDYVVRHNTTHPQDNEEFQQLLNGLGAFELMEKWAEYTARDGMVEENYFAGINAPLCGDEEPAISYRSYPENKPASRISLLCGNYSFAHTGEGWNYLSILSDNQETRYSLNYLLNTALEKTVGDEPSPEEYQQKYEEILELLGQPEIHKRYLTWLNR